jgi:hypothetical protein
MSLADDPNMMANTNIHMQLRLGGLQNDEQPSAKNVYLVFVTVSTVIILKQK